MELAPEAPKLVEKFGPGAALPLPRHARTSLRSGPPEDRRYLVILRSDIVEGKLVGEYFCSGCGQPVELVGVPFGPLPWCLDNKHLQHVPGYDHCGRIGG